MASYNGGEAITIQIDSILKQLSHDDELIISDDGSTDETITNIKHFKDDRIKLFHNTSSKKGPTGNFEHALKQAKGDFIFLSDQDDIWIEGRVKKHMELSHQYDLIISDAIVINELGEVIYDSFFAQRRSKSGLINNLIRNSYIGCCMSFKKELLAKVLPFPDKIHMHDWWIGLVAEVYGKVNFCDEKFLKYIRHENNASPTLQNSNYSFLKRLNNRLNLIGGLINLYFRSNK